jgi:hypothetical protein
MNWITTILEILKYTVPALIVLIFTSSIIKRFLNTEIKRKQFALLRDNQEITVRLRLQAYERLVIFLERIQSRSLVPRVYQPGMTVRELQNAVIYNIKTEFEHNLSQQIYVSKAVWDTVRGVKEQELNMVSNIAQQLKPDDSAKELHSRIVNYILTQPGELPTDVAISMLNDEAKRILSLGASQ